MAVSLIHVHVFTQSAVDQKVRNEIGSRISIYQLQGQIHNSTLDRTYFCSVLKLVFGATAALNIHRRSELTDANTGDCYCLTASILTHRAFTVCRQHWLVRTRAPVISTVYQVLSLSSAMTQLVAQVESLPPTRGVQKSFRHCLVQSGRLLSNQRSQSCYATIEMHIFLLLYYNNNNSVFFFQRLSVLIQLFNSVAIRGTFAHTPTEEEFQPFQFFQF